MILQSKADSGDVEGKCLGRKATVALLPFCEERLRSGKIG